MLEHYLYLSNIILAVTCVLFALVFVTLPLKQNIYLSNYRKSLYFLAGAYCIIAIMNIFELSFQINTIDFISSIFIGLCLSQALLFTITLDNLLNPNKITLTFILKQSIPLLVFIILHSIFVPIWGYPLLLNTTIWLNKLFHPVIILREAFLLVYILQFAYFVRLLFIEEREYNDKINNFSADTIDIQMRWVKYGFSFSAVIGVFSLITTLLSNIVFDLIFNLTLILFYTYFALRFIRYPYVFESIKIIFESQDNQTTELADVEDTKPDITKRYNWPELKQQIIDRQLYLQAGITIDAIAGELGIGRSILSSLINSEEGNNFNFWVNRLRIEEAQRLLLANTNASLLDVSEQVGYTEQSNFSRQFKLHTQMSPSAWRGLQSKSE